MRATIVLLASLVLVPAAPAGPPGFIRAPKLEPAASFVAKRPVKVWCAPTQAAWSAHLARSGLPIATHGTVDVRRREIWLEPVVCDNLAVSMQMAVPTSGYRSLAPSILVFVHESIHLRGELNEGKADCAAARELPAVAVRFFGRHLVVPLLKKEVARYRNASKPVYRTVC